MCISDRYYVKINWLIDWFIVNSVTLIDSSSVPLRNRNSCLKVEDVMCFRTEINLNVIQLLHQPLHIYKIYKMYTLKH